MDRPLDGIAARRIKARALELAARSDIDEEVRAEALAALERGAPA